MNLLAQCISLTGAAFNITSYQMRDNRRLFWCKGISGALFAIHFILLGNYTAAALNFVNLLRGVLLAGGDRFNRRQWLWMVLATYTACGLAVAPATRTAIGGPAFALTVAILATIAELAETIVLWSRDGHRIRIGQLSFVSPFWLFNNIVTGSIGGIITEIFAILSVLVSYIRFGRDGFEQNKKRDS